MSCLSSISSSLRRGNPPVADYLDELDAKQGGKGALDALLDQADTHGAFRLPQKDGGNGRSLGGQRNLRRKHIPPAGLDGRHGQIGPGARLHQKDGEDPAAGNPNNRKPKEHL